jgi:hypothetical protein
MREPATSRPSALPGSYLHVFLSLLIPSVSHSCFAAR